VCPCSSDRFGPIMDPCSLMSKLDLPSKALLVAPMVDASELSFRRLCREYGSTLCWTPMLHSKLFVSSKRYRKEKFTTNERDRPLIAQFCGHDKHILLDAALMVQDKVDCVDLNLGCPQDIARRGRYGAFLLEEPDLVVEIVEHLSKNLRVPVSCKIRLLPDLDKTMELARRLESSGCSLLAVHGRTKEQNKVLVGSSNWKAIKQIKEALKIPVIANGGIGTRDEFQKCLLETGADGVMSAEGILENPALCMPLDQKMPAPHEIAQRYLEIAKEEKEVLKIVRTHLFKLLHGQFEVHRDSRDEFAQIGLDRENFIELFSAIVGRLAEIHSGNDPQCSYITCQTQQNHYGSCYDRYRGENPSLRQEGTKSFQGVDEGKQKHEIKIERILRKIKRRQHKLKGLHSKLRRCQRHGNAPLTEAKLLKQVEEAEKQKVAVSSVCSRIHEMLGADLASEEKEKRAAEIMEQLPTAAANT